MFLYFFGERRRGEPFLAPDTLAPKLENRLMVFTEGATASGGRMVADRAALVAVARFRTACVLVSLSSNVKRPGNKC